MNFDNLSDISRLDILRTLGLSPRMRDYLWPAIGLFSTGVLLGAGVALMLAPKSGAKLRAEIRDEFERKLHAKKHEEEGEELSAPQEEEKQQGRAEAA